MSDLQTTGCPMPDDVCADCGYRCADAHDHSRQAKTTAFPPEWTEGVCGDGAVILRDGVPVTISEVLRILNEYEDYLASLKADLEGALHNRLFDQADAYWEGVRNERQR